LQIICRACAKPFEGTVQRCCSEKCSKAMQEAWFKQRNARRRAERAEARGTLACERCGASFIPVRTSARFCSTKCRVAAHRNPEHTRPDRANADTIKAAFAIAKTPAAETPEHEQHAVALAAVQTIWTAGQGPRPYGIPIALWLHAQKIAAVPEDRLSACVGRALAETRCFDHWYKTPFLFWMGAIARGATPPGNHDKWMLEWEAAQAGVPLKDYIAQQSASGRWSKIAESLER
jgi:ribosomal protein L24E